MSNASVESLVGLWFEYMRRSSGSREERKALSLGEPADIADAGEQVREIIALGGSRAVDLVAALLDAAHDDESLVAVAAGPLEDLLSEHWDDVVDQIDALVRAGGPIRRALRSVELDDEQEAHLRPWIQ